MRFNLTSTPNGIVETKNIKKGDLIKVHGEYIKSPCNAKKKKVYEYTFKTLPSCIFERDDIKYVSVDNETILNEHKETKDYWAYYGFGNASRNSGRLNNFIYQFKYYIKLYEKIPQVLLYGYTPYMSRNNDKQLDVESMSEINLEFYLEGRIRNSFKFIDSGHFKNRFYIGKKIDDFDKIVLRLLNINISICENKILIKNPVMLLKHIKDDYTKSKITDEMVIHALMTTQVTENYRNSYEVMSVKEVEDYIIPKVNADNNTISPICELLVNKISTMRKGKYNLKNNYFNDVLLK